MKGPLKQFFIPGLFGLVFYMAVGCAEKREGNRLADATSPYLREHADNPVEWYEWGPEALRKARQENKPLLISIGYASCHWCHVMEEESFMDTAVARVMNENFVSIKVDREQRPDVDQIYLNAAQLISGSAGWPLNAFALPDGRPFYAGTYFPKDQWLTLLRQVKDAYDEENQAVLKQAEALTQGIGTYELLDTDQGHTEELHSKRFDELVEELSTAVDYVNGGLKGEPKFPLPVVWEFLMQYHFLTGEKKIPEIVRTTLHKMARGAIYDQIGGGFARYSTDSAWRVPHFEKMLCDNAQLVSVYSHAYQLTRDSLYLRVIRETLRFIKSELTDRDGGFFSSINADSEGKEGLYYTWTAGEIRQVAGNADAALVMDYYNVSDAGNWEDGKNILYIDVSDAEFVSTNKITVREWSRVLTNVRDKLFLARSRRTHPSTDDKVITSWNALMLIGYLDAYVATGEKEYLQEALTNAAFLEKEMMRKDGSLWRSYSRGKAGVDGFLDDYALLAHAYIRLYQVTFEMRWLKQARALADHAVAHFRDNKTGMFYYTADRADDLVVRKMELADNVIPSSNSVMSEVLTLLADYYQDSTYASHARLMLTQMSIDRLDRPGMFYANWARIQQISTWEPFEVAVVGRNAGEKSLQLQRAYNPLARFSGGHAENLPLLENKLVEGKTIIYVCRNRVCKMPVEDVSLALEQLKVP